MPNPLYGGDHPSNYPVPPLNAETPPERISQEVVRMVPELNRKPTLNLNDINTVWVEGHALCFNGAATPPTDEVRGNFAVALYPDAADSTGYISTFVRLPGTYRLWLLWAPDTLPASPTTKAVLWTPSITIISYPPTGNTGGVFTNSLPVVSVGAKLPGTADQSVWTPLYDSLKIGDYSTVGLSLNRNGAAAGDDAAVDVYAVGLFFERTGG